MPVGRVSRQQTVRRNGARAVGARIISFFGDPQRRVLEYCQMKSIALNLIRTTGEQLGFAGKIRYRVYDQCIGAHA